MDLRLIEPEHYPELFGFLEREWKRPKALWRERLQLLWDRNPAFGRDPVRGVIARDNGRIIGFIGKYPAEFQVNGASAVSSNGIGIIVDDRYRGMGIGALLKQRHSELSRGHVVFATTPSPVSFKINRKLGFELLPTGMGGRSVYSVLAKPTTRLLSLLAAAPLAAGTYGELSALAGQVLQILKLPRVLGDPAGRGYSVGECTTADSAFDDLWARTRGAFPNTAIRSSQSLNWYIRPTSFVTRRVLVAARAGGRVKGFLILKEELFLKHKVMMCLDLWTDHGERDQTVAALLRYCYDTFAGQAAAILVPHFDAGLHRTLEGLALPLLVGKQRRELWFVPASMKATEMDASNSYFTYLQGDRFVV